MKNVFNQQTIVGSEKFFFDHPQNIREDLIEIGKQLTDKFYNEVLHQENPDQKHSNHIPPSNGNVSKSTQ